MDDLNHETPLHDLNRTAPPPASLERHVRQTLTRRGLLRRGAFGWQRLGVVAAAAVLMVAAYVIGRNANQPPPPAEGRRYALLLYEDSTFDNARPEAELVAEYGAWARSLRRQGRLELGEELGRGEHVLWPGPDSLVIQHGTVSQSAVRLTGFFIIRAGSDEEATAIARDCPHLKHRGRVVLRPIEETG